MKNKIAQIISNILANFEARLAFSLTGIDTTPSGSEPRKTFEIDHPVGVVVSADSFWEGLVAVKRSA